MLAKAVALGAELVKPATTNPWGVAGYFRDPVAFESRKGAGSGVLPGADSGLQSGARPIPSPPNDVKSATETLERAAEHLREALAKMPEFAALKDRIEIVVTAAQA